MRVGVIVGTMLFNASLSVFAYGAFDAQQFASMSKEERVRYVLTQLQHRDELLKAFTVAVDESISNLDGPGIYKRSHYIEKRNGTQLFVHVEHKTGNGDKLAEYDATWDGHIQKTVSWDIGNNKHAIQASTGTDEPAAVRDINYNHLFGFRVKGAFNFLANGKPVILSKSLAEWLQDVLKDKDRDVSADVEVNNGATVIALRIQFRTQIECYFLNPVLQFMPVRYEWNLDRNKKLVSEVHEVMEQRDVSGVFVATKIRSRTRQLGREQEIVSVVKELTIGPIADKEFNLEVPPGTSVINSGEHPIDSPVPSPRQ